MVKHNFKRALKNILKWGYTESESGDEFANRVVRHLQKELKVMVINGSPNINDDIPIGTTLFYQPYGTQSSPDIAIVSLEVSKKVIGGKTGWIPKDSFTIEIKRSKIGKVMWNSGFPTQNRIYLLNTKNSLPNGMSIDGTTMVMGFDLVSIFNEKSVIKLKENLKGMKNQYKGIGTFKLEHLRPMFTQELQEGKWLIHKDRRMRENNVLKFVENSN